jgi:long-chain fatty acid transport protein
MAFVGERADVGLAFFSPMREYTTTGASGPLAPPAFNLVNTTAESDNELFYIPHLGMNWAMGANDTFGVSIYGNGGMNTDYPAEASASGFAPPGTFYSGGATGVDLAQVFFAFTWAHKLAPNAAIGVTPILVYQRFEAFGLQSFAGFSTDGANLTNNGYNGSYGGGLKLGFQSDLGSAVTFGVSYQTEMVMSEFDSYAGLFAEQGDFDIPATGTIGLAWKINPAHTVVLDVQEIFYSDVKSISNPLIPAIGLCGAGVDPATNCLGGNNGSGFGWEDMTIFKLGYQWAVNPGLTLRAGVSQGDQPIPSSEVLFNILAPAVIEQHYTLGATFNVGPNTEVSLAGMYAPSESVSGPNPLAAGSQTIELEMSQYELEASVGIKF